MSRNRSAQFEEFAKMVDLTWVEMIYYIYSGCVLERVEEGVDTKNASSTEEPLLCLIHGLPGAGKTQVIRWLRRYFIEVWDFKESSI